MNAVIKAIQQNNRDAVLSAFTKPDSELVFVAACCGNPDIVQLLLERECPINLQVVRNYANEDVFKVIVQHIVANFNSVDAEVIEAACECAASQQNINGLEEMYKASNGSLVLTSHMVSFAVVAGKLESVKWLIAHGAPVNLEDCFVNAEMTSDAHDVIQCLKEVALRK